MTIMERMEERRMTTTRPHLEWRWDYLAIHAGTLRTQQQASQLIELLEFFRGKLPEVPAMPDRGTVDDSAYVDPVEVMQGMPAPVDPMPTVAGRRRGG